MMTSMQYFIGKYVYLIEVLHDILFIEVEFYHKFSKETPKCPLRTYYYLVLSNFRDYERISNQRWSLFKTYESSVWNIYYTSFEVALEGKKLPDTI